MSKASKSSKASPTLDLHGKKTDEIFDAVEKFLKRYENQSQVRIMPGKGTGKVRDEVVKYLKLANYPWSYERLANGEQNQGVLIVYMD